LLDSLKRKNVSLVQALQEAKEQQEEQDATIEQLYQEVDHVIMSVTKMHEKVIVSVLPSYITPETCPKRHIDDPLDQLGKAKYFSTLNLAAGYWQIQTYPDSRQKTVFVTHMGLHEFCVMPFGLRNMPAVFLHIMQQVLAGKSNKVMELRSKTLHQQVLMLTLIQLPLKKRCQTLPKTLHLLVPGRESSHCLIVTKEKCQV